MLTVSVEWDDFIDVFYQSLCFELCMCSGLKVRQMSLNGSKHFSSLSGVVVYWILVVSLDGA